MESKKQSSVRTVSIVIMVLSIFKAFSNIGGAMVDQMIDLDIPYYFLLCLISAFIALNYLFGSYFLFRGKSWARVFLLQISRLIVLLSLLFPIFAFFIIPYSDESFILKIWSITALVIYVTPLFFLIRYLMKDKIKNHFA